MTTQLDQLRRKAVAQRLVNTMKSRGCTTKELAEAIGVSPGAVSQWRTGTSRMSQDSLDKVAAYLNVSVNYLATGSVEDDSELFPLSPMEMSIIRACRENFPQDTYTSDEKALISAVRDCHTLTTPQITEIVNWLSSASASDLVTALSAFKAASEPATLVLEQ